MPDAHPDTSIKQASHIRLSDDRRAFTLLEMSIVLVIIGMVVAGGMTIFSGALQKNQLQETQMKMKAIQTALLNFRIANNRLPCPADVTLALPTASTPTYFGLEAGQLVNSAWIPDAGSCTTYGTTYTNGALVTTAANSVAADFRNIITSTTNTINSGVDSIVGMASTTNIVPGMGISGTDIPAGDSVASVVNGTTILLTIPATGTTSNATLTIGNNVEGMVPVTTLRLPDDYAVDGWGGRIMYTVDNRFTAIGALTPDTSAITLTANTTSPSPYVTGFTSTNGLSPGMFVYGRGIPVGDSIASVPIVTTGTTTNASVTITAIPSTNGLGTGAAISGTGIPSGDTIATIASGTSITLASAATASNAGVSLTISGGVTLSTAVPQPGINSVPLIFSPTVIPMWNPLILGTDPIQRMTVNDQSGNAKTTQAAYVLLSAGPNGHGAWPRDGAAIGSRINVGSNNADELTNCNCTNAAVSNTTNNPSGIFVQAQPNQNAGHLTDLTYYFDDVVAYGTRSDLRGPTE